MQPGGLGRGTGVSVHLKVSPNPEKESPAEGFPQPYLLLRTLGRDRGNKRPPFHQASGAAAATAAATAAAATAAAATAAAATAAAATAAVTAGVAASAAPKNLPAERQRLRPRVALKRDSPT